jgi:hypothetical protein
MDTRFLPARFQAFVARVLACALCIGAVNNAVSAATATDPWVFVSSPDWFNTDIADLSGGTPGVPAAPGWVLGASGGVNGISPQMRAVYSQLVS